MNEIRIAKLIYKIYKRDNIRPTYFTLLLIIRLIN